VGNRLAAAVLEVRTVHGNPQVRALRKDGLMEPTTAIHGSLRRPRTQMTGAERIKEVHGQIAMLNQLSQKPHLWPIDRANIKERALRIAELL
jgi:hypothetical protein